MQRFTRIVIYGDNKSSSMAEAHADKWKEIKRIFSSNSDCLHQPFIRANYLTYLVLHPLLKKHPSSIGHGWELVDGNCRPVRHTRPTLHLETAEKSEEDEHEETDEEQKEDSEQSEEEWSDLN